VQGVGYRAFTLRAASERRLVGGVRNSEDGRVELEAEGPKDRILSLIEALRIGPPASRVTDVHLEWLPATGRLTDFVVWY
jgi:acylphosphatase